MNDAGGMMPSPAADRQDEIELVEAGGPRRLFVEELGCVPYPEALALQEAAVAAVASGGQETILLLEHPPVYTLGRGADAGDLLGAPERLGVPVHRIGRGGGATFHGPGQLVAYPIVRLALQGRDVNRYVRDLEAALVAVCADFGIAAAADGPTGVWVEGRKIASIGIGVRRGVAYHGIALNVGTDLSYFAHIIPCRGAGLAVTSMEEVLGFAPALSAVGRLFAERLAVRLRAEPISAKDAV